MHLCFIISGREKVKRIVNELVRWAFGGPKEESAVASEEEGKSIDYTMVKSICAAEEDGVKPQILLERYLPVGTKVVLVNFSTEGVSLECAPIFAQALVRANRKVFLKFPGADVPIEIRAREFEEGRLFCDFCSVPREERRKFERTDDLKRQEVSLRLGKFYYSCEAEDAKIINYSEGGICVELIHRVRIGVSLSDVMAKFQKNAMFACMPDGHIKKIAFRWFDGKIIGWEFCKMP